MYQHIDMMVAQSAAREREHELQADLRQRQGIAQRQQVVPDAPPTDRHEWFHGLLERAHLVRATAR